MVASYLAERDEKHLKNKAFHYMQLNLLSW